MRGENDDPNAGGAGGGDWWAQNAPAGGGAPSFDQVNADYQQWLGRPLSQGEYDQFWANAQGYNASMIANSAEGLAYTNQQLGSGSPGEQGPPPAAGGGAPGAGTPAMGTSANFGTPPATYTPPVYTPPAPYVPPTWQGGPPPTAPTLGRYTPPTQAELEASPGYQSRLAAGLLAGNRSAAARGSVLNGGTQKALAQYGQDYASNEYGNLVSQGQNTLALNNMASQSEFGDAFQNYLARYGQFTDSASMGKNAYDTNYGIGKNAFDTNAGNAFSAAGFNVTNKRNSELDYWQRLNDLYQTGAGLAGNSYKPGA